MLKELGGLAEGVTGPERGPVCCCHLGHLAELLIYPGQGRSFGPGVHPADEAQCEKVLGPFCVSGLHPQRGHRVLGKRRHGDLIDGHVVEAAVTSRVSRIAGLGQVAFVERVGVEQQRAPVHQPVQFRLEGSRVHGHQDVRCITRRGDVVIGDMHLEG